jgi:phosphate starvation-inducible PhoH-like protein
VLKKVRGIAFTHFEAEDVVRHPLVQRIVNAYGNYELRVSSSKSQRGSES